MTTYQELKGANILVLSADPSNPLDGQIWYNTTSNTLKAYQYIATNAWASGGNLNTARGGVAYAGIQTAGIGYSATNSESYNGTSWTATPALPVSNGKPGTTGTQTSALAFGNPATTMQWNGSSWTSVPGSVNTARSEGSGVGLTTNAALLFGGGVGATTYANTESYNGTSWTAVNALVTQRVQAGGLGSQTDALCFGGTPSPAGASPTGATQKWNGTSWSTNPTELNTPRRENVGGGGTQPAGLAFGGYNPSTAANTAVTESWNGSSWTNTTNMNSAKAGLNNTMGSQTLTLVAGASGPAPTAATEEWSGTVLTTRTITAS